MAERGDPGAPRYAIADRMAEYGTPGAALAVIEGGKIAFIRGYGTRKAGEDWPVDGDTVFSAGSVSKLVNAALVLRLVQEGTLDLDADIRGYLKRWQPKENRRSRGKPITLRQILAHTAGFSQHGFPDFLPGEPLPSITDTLNGKKPAKHGRVKIQSVPGERMKYSGGGITVSQLVIEDVTGLSYEQAARRYVFDPLKMDRSTFASPLPEDYGNIAYAHDEEGAPTALPRGYEAFPEQAASGLWVSANDLATFMIAFVSDETFLRADLRETVTTRASNSWHGMGLRINFHEGRTVLHHGGANNSYKASVEYHPDTGDGFVTLTNAARGRSLGFELRIAAGEALGWSIPFPEAHLEPEL